MDGTNFIVPNRRPPEETGAGHMRAREAACRLTVCAAVVLATFATLLALAAAGVSVPVPEFAAGP